VSQLHQKEYLDISVIHGDGTTTAAKKGGDNLGFSGHKHFKIKLLPSAIATAMSSPLYSSPWQSKRITAVEGSTATSDPHCQAGRLDLNKTIVSLDGVYDSRANRKAIFNRGMVPNIPENLRGRKTPKRGRKPTFAPAIFQERFHTIERVFAWEDKFRRLLLRFERISELHYALKSLAYTMINLRHFC